LYNKAFTIQIRKEQTSKKNDFWVHAHTQTEPQWPIHWGIKNYLLHLGFSTQPAELYHDLYLDLDHLGWESRQQGDVGDGGKKEDAGDEQ
jgi:hypothetical protein